MVETAESKTQRDQIKNVKFIIGNTEVEYSKSAPIQEINNEATGTHGMAKTKIEGEIEKLRTRGEIYEPNPDHLRVS